MPTPDRRHPPGRRRRPLRRRPWHSGDARSALRTAGVTAACALALTLPGTGGTGPPAPGTHVGPAPAAAGPGGADGSQGQRQRVGGEQRTGPADRRQAAPPARVRIPAIGVDAPVGPLTVGPDGVLPPPRRPGAAGWWRDGPEPGEPGPAVLVGHYDSDTGPAVFHRLAELRPGDRVSIARSDGTTVGYTVLGRESHPRDAFPTEAVYGDTHGRAALRLITCDGAYDRTAGRYTENLIVFASREKL